LRATPGRCLPAPADHPLDALARDARGGWRQPCCKLVGVGVVAEISRTTANRTVHAVADSYDFGMAKAVCGYVVSETVAKRKGAYGGAVAPFE